MDKKKEKHRGKHSQDDQLFGGEEQQKRLKEAVLDLSFLLERGYAEKSAANLVGNHYQLRKRQIQALTRMSCAASAMEARLSKHLTPKELKGKKVNIDGFNLLIGLEVALSGGYLFEGMDSCYRDIAAVHGTYKSVTETIPALELIVKAYKELEIEQMNWYFDQPVSNSGRMKAQIYSFANQHSINWTAATTPNPDKTLIEENEITISSDSWILDKVDQWSNFLQYIVHHYIPKTLIIKTISKT